jgi:hypothetical protein
MRLSPESMNTTLCVAVLIPGHAYVAEIGDGIVAIMRGDKAETVLTEAKGESAATDTHFLQLLGRNSRHAQWRCDDFGPVPAIALSTDGLRYQATSIKEGYAAHPGFFEGLWGLLKSGKLSRTNLEEWLDKTVSQNDPPGDDKTLLLALRAPAAPSSGRETGDQVLRECSPKPPKATLPSDPRPETPSGQRDAVIPGTPAPGPQAPAVPNAQATPDAPHSRAFPTSSRADGEPVAKPRKLLEKLERACDSLFGGDAVPSRSDVPAGDGDPPIDPDGQA